MALTREDLNAIKELMDEQLKSINKQLKSINNRLDKMDDRFDIIALKQDGTNKQLEILQLDVVIAEKDIRRSILELKDEIKTVTKVLRTNELLPQ